MVMGIAYWTLMIGFMGGALAKLIMFKNEHGQIFTTMTIGLIGSVIFGWLGSAFKLYDFGDTIGLVASFIGATSLLFIYYSFIKTYGYKTPPHRSQNVRGK